MVGWYPLEKTFLCASVCLRKKACFIRINAFKKYEKAKNENIPITYILFAQVILSLLCFTSFDGS